MQKLIQKKSQNIILLIWLFNVWLIIILAKHLN